MIRLMQCSWPVSTAPPVSGDLESDWIARSTAPGVVWAHRFNDSNTVARFSLGDVGTKIVHVANDGIIGDGCLSCAVGVGETGSESWGRPLRPIPGDINTPGLPTGSAITTSTECESQFVNMQGGHFGHTDYHAGGGMIGTDYYLQYRIKFSAGRFNPDRFTGGALGSGKTMMLVTNYVTPDQEIVVQARTDFGGKWFTMYTNFGNRWNSFLDASQDQVTGANLQPGGPYPLCTIGTAPDGTDKCFLYPENEWVTVLVHIIPGKQYVVATIGHASNPKNTGIEVWVARAGEWEYTKIWEKFNYEWAFDATYLDTTAQPFGWNWLNFTSYNNDAISLDGFYHRIDQVIFSQTFIECPAP
jgi:hypothetical protein